MEKSNQSKQNSLMIPISIVIAGALIAGSLLYRGEKVQAMGTQQVPETVSNLDAMLPITQEDHVRGDRNAPVKIVEYSDTECPFCKKFHSTMQDVMKEYGDSGKVAWVYRHFPIDQLHSKARTEAEATECAGEQGGDEKFWAYLDRLTEITPANNNLDLAELPKIAEYIGLDVKAFNTCLKSGKYADKIELHVQNAQETGARGTPWSIVVAPNGTKYPLNGALPYATIKQLIDLSLSQK